MIKFICIAVIGLALGCVASAQMASSTDTTLVDGSKTPQGIADSLAYREFFRMAVNIYNDGVQANDGGVILTGFFKSIPGLSLGGQQFVMQAAQSNQAADNVITASMNATINSQLAATATKTQSGTASDVSAHAQMDTQRLALHQSTMALLKQNLSGSDLAALDSFIQTIFKTGIRAPQGQV